MHASSSIEFLGNKTGCLPELLATFSEHVPTGARFVDLFSGTASVSRAAREVGYRVHANDHLPLCEVWAIARVLATQSECSFSGLDGLSERGPKHRYLEALRVLESTSPNEGWLTKHYSPVSLDVDGVERRYLTAKNAMLADGIREQIESWRPHLTVQEHALLLASLVSGVNSVSNIAGTYGCYLKSWKPRAEQSLALRPWWPLSINRKGHVVSRRDSLEIVQEISAEAMYADPPYTKRQYGAYYHLLNSLVMNDEPAITGKTGLPHWETWSSDWCYARRALKSLELLVGKASCEWFFLSYSSDGHIPHASVMDLLSTYGSVSFTEWEYRRYRSSQLKHRDDTVLERLYAVKKC